MIAVSDAEIDDLEEKVNANFYRFKAAMTPRTAEAWNLARKFRDHHPRSYLDDLKVSLKTAEVLEQMLLPPQIGAYGGLLHDTGKITIPVAILDKAYGVGGEYTVEDHEIMKTHPIAGFNILMEAGFMMSAWIAATHHYFKKPVPVSDPRAFFKNPYPITLPEYPVNTPRWRAVADFNSQIVSIVDQYDAFRRPNNMYGKEPLTQDRIKELMIEENESWEYTISKLYKAKVFV